MEVIDRFCRVVISSYYSILTRDVCRFLLGDWVGTFWLVSWNKLQTRVMQAYGVISLIMWIIVRDFFNVCC